MKIFAVKYPDGTYFTRGSVYSNKDTPEFWPSRARAERWAKEMGAEVEEWEAAPVKKELHGLSSLSNRSGK